MSDSNNGSRQFRSRQGRLFEDHVIEEARKATSSESLLYLLSSIEFEKRRMANQPDVAAYIERTKQHVEKRFAELKAGRREALATSRARLRTSQLD